jgi:hypothetical protein
MGIKPPKRPGGGKIPPPAPLSKPHLTLSFKYFKHREPFVFPDPDKKPNYPLVLFERFRDLCGMTAADLRANRSKAVRSHPIQWHETTEPDGFDHLNPQLREQITGWQLTHSANEYGRIHGFWIDEVYYVVWIDHDHSLYE